MSLYLITPILGFLRNYIKYKQCNVKKFIRTPIAYLFFHFVFSLLGYRNIVWRTLIFERWYFFIDKSFMSWWKNDYIINKEKYKIKYGLQYDTDADEVLAQLDVMQL